MIPLRSVLLFLLFCTLSPKAFTQLANSNYGLRGKMGITLNQELSRGVFDYRDADLALTQKATNFQASFPLLLKIDTLSPRVKLNIVKAEYTFRNVENLLSGSSSSEQALLPEDLYANSIGLTYLHTIGYPWMLQHSVKFTLAGDYGSNNPLNINASSFLLRRMNKRLILGLGLLYQQIADERSFLVVPFLGWQFSRSWFVDIALPDRILIGKNIGKKKVTQLAWGTYIEFFTRFAFEDNTQNKLYENFDISSGIDFRTQIKGKLFLNVFVGNNFYKAVTIRDNDLNRLENVSTFSGLNARIGFSLNLQD